MPTCPPCPIRMGTATCSAPEVPAWMPFPAKPYLHMLVPPACPMTHHRPIDARRPPQPLLNPRGSISHLLERCKVYPKPGTETRRQMGAAASKAAFPGDLCASKAVALEPEQVPVTAEPWQLFNLKAQTLTSDPITSSFSALHLAFGLGKRKVKSQKEEKPRYTRCRLCSTATQAGISPSPDDAQRGSVPHDKATSPTIPQGGLPAAPTYPRSAPSPT